MKDGVYVLKNDSSMSNGIEFKKNQEIELVGGVIYVSGFPLPFSLQATVLSWMDTNKNLFLSDTRDY